ncbi:hypothetical protein JR316_0012393 [Psilocybe cubensis]|uniref:Uncharacterized protein n=2 Tax=Psilocybe cubensis TaxID=181762 RepID=A0A8H8CGU0_PSICU|nr:hypothetical protein JR316_0012393 [Psilocybe cubensis]KAH9475282.1 hypothetical protein JR316_0012393 [Psilocybe cubensis]
MGYRGLKAIVAAMERNWTLEKVNLFANNSLDESEAAGRTDDLADYNRLMSMVKADFSTSQEELMVLAWGSGCGLSHLESKLKIIIGRNILYKRQVKKEAVDLLRYSRLMLHKPVEAPLSFGSLPIELQLSVLSHTAPFLSTSQRIRIFEYAVNKSTLPNLRLHLPVRKPSLDPTPSPKSGKKIGSLGPRNTNISGGVQRKMKIDEWLESVGCDSYDPEPVN